MRSFFDDTLPQTSFWEKQSLKVEEKNLEYQSILFEKSKKTGFWVSRNYIIYESKLVKLKTNSKLNHFVNLNKALIEKIKYENKQEKDNCNKKRYGIRIVRNQQHRELYSRTKEQNKLLLEVLKKHAILLNFKENYTIDRIIGKGNFAKVYLCVSKSSNEQYAVKAFEKCKLPNNADVDKLALQKEIQIMRQINYKGLIKMHEVYEDNQCIYIVQDYLQGGELYHQIKKNQKLEEKVVAGIIATLLDSLDYLHKKNILHRDLKPENMILRTKGSLQDVVIADFGLADFYDPFGNYMFQRCGTPGFVAPEVLQDRIYDSKVDVFSVGCLMYLLLAGKSPFKGNTYDEVVMRNYHCKIDYPYIEKIVSINCIGLLKRLLHEKPSSRPTPREALRQEWFQLNLDKQRYQELNEEIQDTKESAKSSAGSCGFMKNFIGPIVTCKPEFSTPQSQPLSKSEKCPMTPQIVLMQQIQEQMDDCEEQLGKFDDDLSDLMIDEESPQSHKMPQYQLVGKLKQVVDSRNSSYYASPNINMTPQMQHKQIQTQVKEKEPCDNQPTKIVNKIMNSLKTLEQI